MHENCLEGVLGQRLLALRGCLSTQEGGEGWDQDWSDRQVVLQSLFQPLRPKLLPGQIRIPEAEKLVEYAI